MTSDLQKIITSIDELLSKVKSKKCCEEALQQALQRLVLGKKIVLATEVQQDFELHLVFEEIEEEVGT